MAYLPAQPLVEQLRMASEPRCIRGGPHLGSTGMEAVAQELARIKGCSVASAHRELRRIVNGGVRMVSDSTADAVACALHMHPRRIWPAWHVATDPVTEELEDVAITYLDALDAGEPPSKAVAERLARGPVSRRWARRLIVRARELGLLDDLAEA